MTTSLIIIAVQSITLVIFIRSNNAGFAAVSAGTIGLTIQTLFLQFAEFITARRAKKAFMDIVQRASFPTAQPPVHKRN